MYERFEMLLKEHNLSVAEFCRRSGMSKSTLSEWKKGRFKLKEDKRKQICQFFGCSLAWFDGETDEFEPNGKAQLFNVAAGEGCFNDQYATETTTETDEEGCSWCVVRGNSMYPVLMDGDRVLVHHQTETSPRDLTVIKVNGDEATIKHVQIVTDGIWLRAENKEVFEDRFYSVQEVLTLPVSIIGKVVEARRSF